MTKSEENSVDKETSLTFLQVTLSILASMFGVQSDKNRIRDFTYGKPIHFIVGGIVFVIIFLALVLIIVKIALSI